MKTLEQVKAEIKEKTEETSYPVKPKSFGKKYDFPEDLTKLTSGEIGYWMSMLAAYRGYVVRQLGLVHIHKNLLQEVWKNAVNNKIHEIEHDEKNKGLTKTALKEKASEEVTDVDRNEIVQVSQMYELYETLIRIYDGQLEILSREISRRKGEV